MSGGIERVVTHGTFELDGGSWEVDNNIWIVGDDAPAVVIDAAHDAGPIVEGVGGRHVLAMVYTHGHNDHVTAARTRRGTRRPGAAAPRRRDALAQTHPDKDFRTVERRRDPRRRHRTARHRTPRALPRVGKLPCPRTGACSPATPCSGGPGATGRPTPTSPPSSTRSGRLPRSADTAVHTGHGDSTTIGDESSTTTNGSPAATDVVRHPQTTVLGLSLLLSTS